MKPKTIIVCKECEWFVTDPNKEMGDLEKCDNCGKKYEDTESVIEDIVKIENSKYILEAGKEI